MLDEKPPSSFDIDDIVGEDWRTVLESFTSDMDPWAVDIIKLSERYRKYLEKLDEMNLEIPARVVFVCAALLKMKARLLQSYNVEEGEAFEEEYDGWEDFEEFEEPERRVDAWKRRIEVPKRTLKPKVKKRPMRRVSFDELKEALEKAMDIKQRRETRRRRRKENEDYMIDLSEEDISDQLDSLMERLESFFDSEGATSFERILERKDREERLQKFSHILRLETDERIRCRQEEFFGDIEIFPKEG